MLTHTSNHRIVNVTKAQEAIAVQTGSLAKMRSSVTRGLAAMLTPSVHQTARNVTKEPGAMLMTSMGSKAKVIGWLTSSTLQVEVAKMLTNMIPERALQEKVVKNMLISTKILKKESVRVVWHRSR